MTNVETFNLNNAKLIETLEICITILNDQKDSLVKLNMFEKSADLLDAERIIAELQKRLETHKLPRYLAILSKQ